MWFRNEKLFKVSTNFEFLCIPNAIKLIEFSTCGHYEILIVPQSYYLAHNFAIWSGSDRTHLNRGT